MANDLIKALTSKETLIPAIEKVLIGDSTPNMDRKHGWNSPSSNGTCYRARYYNRVGLSPVDTFPPRTLRIFSNGHDAHARIQEYLARSGILLMEEVPIFNKKYKVIGHGDGLVDISPTEVALIEIKTINSKGFQSLKDEPQEKHTYQAQIYLEILERMRQFILEDTNNEQVLLQEYMDFLNTFVPDGKKYTKEEKLVFNCNEMTTAIYKLKRVTKPITKIIFLYENKDTQELKEIHQDKNPTLIKGVLEDYEVLNEYVENKIEPERPPSATTRGCNFCRWCDYKINCW